MAVKVTRFDDLPVIMFEPVPPEEMPGDAIVAATETTKFKKELGTPVYRIMDVRNSALDFSALTINMGAERDMEGGSGDPDVTTLFVGSSDLVEMGTKALAEQEQYGKGNVYLFETPEAALEFVRISRPK